MVFFVNKYDRNVGKNQSNCDIISAYFLRKKDGGFAVESDYEKSRKSMSSNVFLKVIVKKFNLKSVQAKLNSSLLRQYLKKHSNN